MIKDKINRYLIIGILSLFLALSTVSCGLYHSVFDDKVVTTEDNVLESTPRDHIAKAPVDGIIPKDKAQALKDSGKEIVIVDKTEVKDPSKAIEITNPNADTVGDVLTVGVGILGKLLPGIGALEGLGVLLSQRKRQHYADAVKAILPTDGSVDLAGGLVSVAKALGFVHTDPKTNTAQVQSVNG